MLWYGDEQVFTAKVEDRQLTITYGVGWQEFLNDASYPQFKDKVASLNIKLEQAPSSSKGAPKGSGKGKDGKKGKKVSAH